MRVTPGSRPNASSREPRARRTPFLYPVRSLVTTAQPWASVRECPPSVALIFCGNSDGGWLPDQPVMPERICEASLSEAIGLISDRKHLYGTCRHRLRRGRVRLLDEKVKPDARSAQRLRAEIGRRRRFIYNTEPCLADPKIDHELPVRRLDPRDLDGAERRLIELHRSSRISHGKNRCDRSDDHLTSAELLGQPDENALGASDVAEPIHVLVLDNFVDELRAVLAEPGQRIVEVVHREHHAEVAERVDRRVPVIGDRRRRNKAREFDLAVA